MHTSRLTSTLRHASCRDPAARLVDTTARSSCGEMPTAIASENSSASMTGRYETTLMTKMAAVSTPATRTSSMENLRSPTWNSVSGWCSPRPRAIRPNSACPPWRPPHRCQSQLAQRSPSARSSSAPPAASRRARPRGTSPPALIRRSAPTPRTPAPRWPAAGRRPGPPRPAAGRPHRQGPARSRRLTADARCGGRRSDDGCSSAAPRRPSRPGTR